VGEGHFHLVALAARVLEAFRVGKRTHVIAHVPIDVARDLAGNRNGALLLQRANRAVLLARLVIDNASLIDVAGAGQLCAARTDVDVALLVEGEVGPASGRSGARHAPPWSR